jgi:hypothetical protein
MTREESEAMAAKLGVQLPSFRVLATGDGWEVRQYQPLMVIECEYEKRPEGYEVRGARVLSDQHALHARSALVRPCS